MTLGTLKKYIASVFVLGIMATPFVSLASASEISFGGVLVYSLYCTCSENFLNIVYDYDLDEPLYLVYQPGASVLFSNYDVFTEGTEELGTYIPGAGECSYYLGEACVTITAEGMYGLNPGTGTSMLTIPSRIALLWDKTVRNVKTFMSAIGFSNGPPSPPKRGVGYPQPEHSS